jgi:two-component sensor histidine kinase
MREGSDLTSMMKMILAPHDRPDVSDHAQFTISGPVVSLGERATNGLALVFHELATNAAKYGALKDGQGLVAVAWHQDDGKLVMTWKEQGGPKIDGPPTRAGFGTILSKSTIEAQMQGTLAYDWRPEGLHFTLSLPVSCLAS